MLFLCQENFTAPRIVLAASGVEHEELVKIAEPLLSDLPKTTRPEEPKSVYVGGEYRRQADATVCYDTVQILNYSHVLPTLSYFITRGNVNLIVCFSFLGQLFIGQQITHLALAFEVPGGWQKEKDAMAVTVLQVLKNYSLTRNMHNAAHNSISFNFVYVIL